jgi:hypothetical protein
MHAVSLGMQAIVGFTAHLLDLLMLPGKFAQQLKLFI